MSHFVTIKEEELLLNGFRQTGFTGSVTAGGNFGLLITVGKVYPVCYKPASKIGMGEVSLPNTETITFEGN
jgi:hypothetical protein